MNSAALGIFEAPNLLRRVRKVEPIARVLDRQDPYSILMACWVDFMRVDDRDLGSRGMRLVGSSDSSRDVHSEQYLADVRMGEAVNAMVDSLSIQHRWAIYRSQGISTAWRFLNSNYADVLEQARDTLEHKLRKHVATRLYFS